MPTPLRCLLIAPSLLVFAALSQPAAAQAALPGWTYTMNITTDSGAGVPRTSMAMRQQVTARYLRMETLQISGMAALAAVEGSFTVFDFVDSTVTTVMPNQRMATVMGLGMMRDAQAGQGMTMAQHLTRSDLEDLGAGERISGHSTHHVRVTSAGTLDVSMMGETCSRQIQSVSEMWIAPDVDFGAVAAAATQRLGSLNGGQAAVVTQDGIASAAMPKGTAIRTITRTTHPNAQGKQVTVTQTMDIIDVNQRPINAAVFAVPADFQTMDMRKMMADMPAGMMDSAMKAGRAKGAPSVARAICGTGGQ